jgi:hypothetical protein
MQTKMPIRRRLLLRVGLLLEQKQDYQSRRSNVVEIVGGWTVEQGKLVLRRDPPLVL